jgi:hypothetical protein
MSGHLFIIDGDLTQIACDAILIPTDAGLVIENHWIPFLEREGHLHQLADLRKDRPECWAKTNMIKLERKQDHPQVWLGNIGKHGEDSAFTDFAAEVEEFITAAAFEYHQRGKNSRIYEWPKPRLALPVVGSDRGGGANKKGDLILGLIETLGPMARRPDLDADIILVTHGARPYAAAQRARRTVVNGVDDSSLLRHWQFENKPDAIGLIGNAQRLASEATHSQLVLFLGAGVSAGAGLPIWQGLLHDIAKLAGLENLDRLDSEDERDQATILQGRLETQGRRIGELVAERLTSQFYSLAHGLLASLPSREAVTTNYDELFEAAWRSTGSSVKTLPMEAAQPNDRWLMKLHGSVSSSDSIVITRSDYLDMPLQNAALLGLVQGLLMTRHMVFVGYGLNDEDFHELIHEVSRARGDAVIHGRVGTVLTLQEDPFKGELWMRDLYVVPMTVDSDIKIAARQLEMFLDLVSYLSTTSAEFLLDATYDAVLTPEERELRNKLLALHSTIEGAATDTVAGKVLRFLDEELGASLEE